MIEKDFGPDGVLRALITLHYLLERQILNFVDLFQKDWHLNEVVSIFNCKLTCLITYYRLLALPTISRNNLHLFCKTNLPKKIRANCPRCWIRSVWLLKTLKFTWNTWRF